MREALERWGRARPERARRMLELADPAAASRIAPGNLRYTLRAIEILLVTGRRASDRLSAADAWADRFRVVKLGVRPAHRGSLC